jgi:hypothetical protein
VACHGRAGEVGVRLESVDVHDMHELMLAGASPRGMSQLLRARASRPGRGARPRDAGGRARGVLRTVAHRLCLQPVYELRPAGDPCRAGAAILERVPGGEAHDAAAP